MICTRSLITGHWILNFSVLYRNSHSIEYDSERIFLTAFHLLKLIYVFTGFFLILEIKFKFGIPVGWKKSRKRITKHSLTLNKVHTSWGIICYKHQLWSQTFATEVQKVRHSNDRASHATDRRLDRENFPPCSFIAKTIRAFVAIVLGSRRAVVVGCSSMLSLPVQSPRRGGVPAMMYYRGQKISWFLR